MYKRLKCIIDSCERLGFDIKSIDNEKEIIVSSRGSTSFANLEKVASTKRMNLEIPIRKVVGNITIINDEALTKYVGNKAKSDFIKQPEEVIIKQFIECTGYKPGAGNPVINIANALYRKYYNSNRKYLVARSELSNISKREFYNKVSKEELVELHVKIYGDYPDKNATTTDIVERLYNML